MPCPPTCGGGPVAYGAAHGGAGVGARGVEVEVVQQRGAAAVLAEYVQHPRARPSTNTKSFTYRPIKGHYSQATMTKCVKPLRHLPSWQQVVPSGPKGAF